MITLTLDTVLQKRDITRYELAKRTGIQYQIIDNYYKNKVKRYDSFVLDRICDALDCEIQEIVREALMKSTRADSERFCFRKKGEKSRNTVCISDFSACISGEKDPLLSRRRFIQSFLRYQK